MVPCPQRQQMSQDSGGLAFSTPLSPAPLSPVPLGPRRLSHSSQTLGQKHWGKSDFLPMCVLSTFLKYFTHALASIDCLLFSYPCPSSQPSSLRGWDPPSPPERRSLRRKVSNSGAQKAVPPRRGRGDRLGPWALFNSTSWQKRKPQVDFRAFDT